ncbi:MAG TPA: PAS domain S-box protein, partial [Terriglobia bacterium]|nr:PAS domain S-box protein [Terriglobia bacterium]
MRKQTEENLRLTVGRFLVALQNSPVVVFNQDRKLRYTWINQPVPPWSEMDYLGKTDEDIIGLADGGRLSALKWPVLETGIGTRKEWSFVWRGELRVYDINIQPLRNQAGEITGITCASTDITEHKRAEDRLHEYEKAVEGLEEMIVVVDRNYRYRIANRAFLDYRGMQREQLIGRHIAEVLNPGVFENVVRAKLDECLQGKAVTYEMKYTYPKLGERDLLLSYFPIDGPNGVDRVASILQDVTERKRAEERLRGYEKVVEGLEEMIVVVDRNYRYQIANRAFLAYRGLEAEQLIGRHVADVLEPGIFEDYLKAKMDECFQGKAITFEMRYTYPRLGERDLLISYSPVEGTNGIDRLACILQDITERKHAEKALRDSESRYRLLFEGNPAGVFRSTLDGKLLEANEAFARMFGYGSREELLHLSNAHFYLDPEQRAPLVARLRQQGSVTEYEFCGRHRDGSPVWVLANMAHVAAENGSPGVLEGTFVDVTGRKKAEEALQRSEGQLRGFIENAPYGIFRCAGNHFLSANPALAKMLGYGSEVELLKLNLADDVFYRRAECPDLAAISAQPGEFGPVEVNWKRRDGALVLLRLRGRVAGASNGEKTIEAIAEDITQQRALEEYLSQSDRLEALGRLASGVAHDFNNLLLGITLNLEHVLQHSKGSGNLVWEEIEQALHAARNAAAVTRQLLVFGRKRSPQRQSVNLNDVVIRSQDLVNRLAGENIHVNLRLSPKLDLVLADPVQVQQVILNLVANARDAMAGRGQITIATRTTELQQAPPDEYFAAVPKAGTYVMLEVSDTGSGITHEALTHIFEPFFTTKAEGSGLG